MHSYVYVYSVCVCLNVCIIMYIHIRECTVCIFCPVCKFVGISCVYTYICELDSVGVWTYVYVLCAG